MRAKLLAGFGVVTALLICVGVVGLAGQLSLETKIDSLKNVSFKGRTYVGEIDTNLLEIRIASLQHVASTDPAKMAEFEGKMESYDQEIVTAFADLGKLPYRENLRDEIAKLQSEVTAYQQGRDEQTLRLSREGDKDGAERQRVEPLAKSTLWRRSTAKKWLPRSIVTRDKPSMTPSRAQAGQRRSHSYSSSSASSLRSDLASGWPAASAAPLLAACTGSPRLPIATSRRASMSPRPTRPRPWPPRSTSL